MVAAPLFAKMGDGIKLGNSTSLSPLAGARAGYDSNAGRAEVDEIDESDEKAAGAGTVRDGRDPLGFGSAMGFPAPPMDAAEMRRRQELIDLILDERKGRLQAKVHDSDDDVVDVGLQRDTPKGRAKDKDRSAAERLRREQEALDDFAKAWSMLSAQRWLLGSTSTNQHCIRQLDRGVHRYTLAIHQAACVRF